MKRVLVAIAVLWFFPMGVFAKSWSFDQWVVDVFIHKDGTATIQEMQTFDFDGDFSWVTRTISKNRVNDITNVRVFDGDGTELFAPDIEIAESISDVRVQVNFSASNESRSWTFQYDVIGGVGFFEDYDEFYWNAVSADRDVPIDEVVVFVHLPEDVAEENIRQLIYSGGYGETSTLPSYSVLSDGTLAYEGQGIQPNENFTIVAGWPKGIVTDPGTVRVESSIPGNVIIDGRDTGIETPAAFQIGFGITEGEHTIEVSSFGHASDPQRRTITVQAGETQGISFELSKTPWYQALQMITRAVVVALLLSPFVVMVVLFRRWSRFGKDPAFKTTIIPHYEPPDNVPPGIVGLLIDERADKKDLIATIVDLAVRGYIRIIENEKGIFKKKEYSLERLRDSQSGKLHAYERLLMNELFDGKPVVNLKDLSGKFYKVVPKIEKAIEKEEQKTVGYFDEIPSTVRKRYGNYGILMMVVGFFALFFSPVLQGIVVAAAAALLINGLLVMLFGRTMPRRTQKGVEALWRTKGFKMFLHKAERFRLKRMTPETFEKYLPYAMVLGVEKEWAERFADIYTEPPSWYVSSSAFTHGAIAASLTSSLSSFSAYSSSKAMSAPSSSGSGFGGGGFSGGGGGGGGSGAG